MYKSLTYKHPFKDEDFTIIVTCIYNLLLNDVLICIKGRHLRYHIKTRCNSIKGVSFVITG